MANRYSKAVANCRVLSPDDDSHVSQMTALDTKQKELADASLVNPDENQVRARETARRRKQDSARPI